MNKISVYELYNKVNDLRQKSIYDPKEIAKILQQEMPEWTFDDLYKEVNIVIQNQDSLDTELW